MAILTPHSSRATLFKISRCSAQEDDMSTVRSAQQQFAIAKAPGDMQMRYANEAEQQRYVNEQQRYANEQRYAN